MPDALSPQGAPRAGIVVVMFNAKTFWPRLAAALAKQTEQNFRVLIVDNGSAADQRLSRAELPVGYELLQLHENIGSAAANNLAARRLDTEFLVLLNADAFPEPEWLARLIAAADRRPHAAAFGSTQLRADTFGVFDGVGDAYWAGGHPYRSAFGRPRKFLASEGEVFSVSAVASLHRRATFLSLGGFDERFFSVFEDSDYGFRLRLMGGCAIQAPDAVVRHVAGGTMGRSSPFRTYHRFRNRLWMFVKNMPPQFFWFCLPGHVAFTGVSLFFAALRGSWSEAWLGLKHGWKDLPMIIESRRELQAKRKVKLIALAKALTWSPIDPILRRPKVWAHEPEITETAPAAEPARQ